MSNNESNRYIKQGERIMIDTLKILFPALMVTGALGSLVLNICTKGDWTVSLQWFGAMLLYTALLFRNK